MTNFQQIDIHELLPQQEPFVMVGKLTYFDMDRTCTQTVVSESNIFTENAHFTAAGLIENIAQTCAARIGYINKYILGKDISVGYIGAIRNLNIHRLPKIGEVIDTAIIRVEEVFGMTLVSATVKAGDEILVDAEMKIAVTDNDPVQ